MRGVAKHLVAALCRLTVLPAYAAYRITARFVDADKAFHGASQRASLWPGIVGEYRRREFYRMTLDECSDDCCLSFGTIFSKRHARVGRRVYVGTHCNLGLVTLGDALSRALATEWDRERIAERSREFSWEAGAERVERALEELTIGAGR